jgi:hypothetical protein
MGTPVYVASAYAGFGEKVGFEKKDPTTLNLMYTDFFYISAKSCFQDLNSWLRKQLYGCLGMNRSGTLEALKKGPAWKF